MLIFGLFARLDDRSAGCRAATARSTLLHRRHRRGSSSSAVRRARVPPRRRQAAGRTQPWPLIFLGATGLAAILDDPADPARRAARRRRLESTGASDVRAPSSGPASRSPVRSSTSRASGGDFNDLKDMDKLKGQLRRRPRATATRRPRRRRRLPRRRRRLRRSDVRRHDRVDASVPGTSDEARSRGSSVQSAATISAISSPASVGLRPTLHAGGGERVHLALGRALAARRRWRRRGPSSCRPGR